MENRSGADNGTKEIKQKRSFGDTLIGMLLTFLIIFLLGTIVSGFVNIFLYILLNSDLINGNFFSLFLVYFSVFCEFTVFIPYCMIFKSSRPVLNTLSFKNSRNSIKMAVIGLFSGAALNVICILAAYLNKNIDFGPGEKNPLLFFLLFIVVLGQSSAEEFLCRGIMYHKIKKRYNAAAAIIVNALFFGLMHLANPGVSLLAVGNIILYGIFISLVMYYTESMWCCCMLHAAWNFTQNIVFGLPNSGIKSTYSILSLKGDQVSDVFFYNTDFGVEGTGIVCVELAAAIVLILLAGRKIGVKEKCEICDE